MLKKGKISDIYVMEKFDMADKCMYNADIINSVRERRMSLLATMLP